MDDVGSLGDMEGLGCDEDQCVKHGTEEEVTVSGDAASPTLDTLSMQAEKVCVFFCLCLFCFVLYGLILFWGPSEGL